jgi:FtsP/CotA-like multicopper oxidase with cupredoxin domain
MNKTYLIVVVIIIVLGGAFLFSRNQQSALQTGEFSTQTQQANATKPQEVVTLKNGDSYDLTASIVKKNLNGTDVKMLAYNGSIPGPLIKVPQGSEIKVKFTNNTDVDSTIHSHGVRVDNKFDGVPDITQDPVKPGQSFTYTLKFPDVGMFWYHPHIREDYAQELGLYGNFLVTPNTTDYWAEVDREEALFLDDILIENGKIAAFSRETVDHTLMGRFGNTMLVNGDDNYKLSVKQGERVRFYLTNAANSRVFNFAIPNTRMKLVGSDNGKYEQEEWVESVVIGPSERQIVEIWFDKDGEYQIQNKTPEKTYKLGIIAVAQNPVATSFLLVPRTNQDVIDAINPLRPLFAKAPDKDIKLTLQMGPSSSQDNNSMGGHMMGNGMMMQNEEMQMNMGGVEKIEWEDDMGIMNAQSTKDTLKWKIVDTATNKENMDLNWQFKKGDVVKIKVFNDDKSMHPMQHPIHIHGQKFLVLSTNGVSNKNLVWKDTTLIQTGDTVELLVQMDNPGDWVIHCHIPEHMESGMMSEFKVL